jgi:hypothetical protein
MLGKTFAFFLKILVLLIFQRKSACAINPIPHDKTGKYQSNSFIVIMDKESEYVDYDVFLDPSFSPISFANSLVQATNNAGDVEVDLEAPSKRLSYDVEEVEKITNSITEKNYQELINQVSNVSIAQEALVALKSNLDQVNSSYSKLHDDVLNPYEQSQQIYSALRRLHLTSGLLRSLTWYLYLARQLSGQVENSKTTSQIDSTYRAAQTLLEIRHQLETNPGLKSLQIIRAHEQSLNDVEQTLKLQAQNTIKFYSLLQDKQKLTFAFQTL